MARKSGSDSPRILLGPWNRSIEWLEQIQNGNVIVFGKDMPLEYEFFQDSMTDLFDRLPTGWDPEALVFWQPHLYAMPAGWEKSGIPVFGIIGPWQLLGLFDSDLSWLRTLEGIFVYPAGVDYFKRQGFEKVWPFLPYSFNPALHYPDPKLEKIYDISFAGELVHPIHRDRAALLYRLSKMADHYRIAFFDWVLGPEQYARLLRQTRIVFNHSYRGELNIRSFEAMASGALLFLEDTNYDITMHFEAGLHYISYNESNYIDLLDYYLTHETQRKQIAENARRKVQRHTNAGHINWLIDRISSIVSDDSPVRPKTWTFRQQGINYFADFYSPMTLERARSIQSAWLKAEKAGDDVAWIKTALAAVDFSLARSQPQEKRAALIESARRNIEKAVELRPDWVWPRVGLGQLHYAVGEKDSALRVLEEAVMKLRSDPEAAIAEFGPYIPYDYDHFMVAWIETNLRLGWNCKDYVAEWAKLIEARCHEIMGKIYLERGKAALAKDSFSNAVKLRPDIGYFHLCLAKANEQVGDFAKALDAITEAIKIDAISPEAWITAAQLLLKLDRYKDCIDFCVEHLTALKAFPTLQKAAAPLRTIRTRALQLSSGKKFQIGLNLSSSSPSTYYYFSRPDIQELVPKTAQRILDVGCAAGELGRMLKARQNCEVTGIEYNPEAASVAYEILDKVLTGDVVQIAPSLPENHFDCIILADVLEHLPEPATALKSLIPCLMKSGHFVLSIPNVRHWSVIRNLLEGHWEYQNAGLLDRTHLRFFTKTSFEKLLKNVGLHPVLVKSTSINYEPIPKSVVQALRKAGIDVTTLSNESQAYQYLYLAKPCQKQVLHSLTSIIILTHNQYEYTKKCVEGILRLTTEPFELVFVDNGSTDATSKYLKELKNSFEKRGGTGNAKDMKHVGNKKRKKKERRSIKYSFNKACRAIKLIRNDQNLGFAAGNNQGLAVASGDYILLMNNDVVVTPGWLGRMISCAQRNPKCGIVGPRSNYVSGPQLVKEVAYDTNTLRDLNRFAKDYSEKHDGRGHPIGRVVGFCMLIKRAVIERIGGLDTRYGLGNFEDDDFSLRAALAGFESWIAEDCFVHHFGSRTFIGANIDYRESLNEKWEIFKEKWGMPKGLPYGSYDFSQISDKFFDPAKHYYYFREKEPSISGAGVSEDRDYEIKSAPRTEAHLRSLDKTITASIIVPVSKTSNNIRKCLDSINRHTLQAHEIIFVDLGARRSTLNWLREISKKDSKYRLMENRKNIAKSCIRSYNEAINSSMGEYIVFLCDDLLVFEDWLSRMLECCNSLRDVGIVGPMTNFSRGIQGLPDSDHLELDQVADYAKTFGERNGFRRVPTRHIDSFCMLLKRELVESIGLFDEELDSDNFAEDFCLRAALEGYRSFIAGDVFIYRNTNHVPVPSKRKLNEKWSGIDSKSEIGMKLLGLNALEKAHKLSQSGDINKAVDTLLQSIGGLPEKKELYYALSEILIDAKQFKDAVEVLNEMPEDHEGEKGVYEDTELSESPQKDIKKLELLGYCKEGLLLYDDAQEIADRLLAFNPNHALALNLKGILAYRKGNIDAARSFFESAVSADPGYGEPYTNLGTLKWTRELREEAVDLYERGFILSPTVTDIVTIYHSAVTELHAFKRAELIFRNASALHPNDKRLKYLLIDVLIQQGKHDLAMGEIEDSMVRFGADDGMLSAALKVRQELGPMEVHKINKRGTLSLCMIVKDEEKHLPRCLSSAKPVVDEIIVVDTGSIDRTKDVASAFGAKVYDFQWNSDFSAARNYSISKAEGSWILVMDADEVISPTDYTLLEQVLKNKRNESIAYTMTTRNYTANPGITGWTSNDRVYSQEEAGTGWFPSSKVRLFPNDDRIRFENSVHELVEPSLEKSGFKHAACNVVIHHYGKMDNQKVVSKGEAYYRLGKAKLKEKAADVKALIELAIQAGELGRYEDAVELWQRVIRIQPNSAIAFHNMGHAYFELEKYKYSLIASRKAMDLDPALKGAHLNYAICELCVGDPRKAIYVLEDLLKKTPDYPAALIELATAYSIDGNREKAIQYLDRVRKMGYNCTDYLYKRAIRFIVLQRIDYTKKLLETAVESNNVNKDVLSLLSECYTTHRMVNSNAVLQVEELKLSSKIGGDFNENLI